MQGIMFKPFFIPAIENGEKTQTRRLIKTGNNIAEFPLNDGGSLYDRITGDFIRNINPRYKVGKIYYCRSNYSLAAKDATVFVRITGVRCEKLQSISHDDCIAEGINSKHLEHIMHKYGWANPRKRFEALINNINGKDTWRDNPFVWVYNFELLEVKCKQ